MKCTDLQLLCPFTIWHFIWGDICLQRSETSKVRPISGHKITAINVSQSYWQTRNSIASFLGKQNIHFHFRENLKSHPFHVSLLSMSVDISCFSGSDPSRLSLRTDTVNKHSFRRSCQRRQTTNENKCGQASLSVFSKIGTSPLNEVICPQLWQHLNLALLVLTLSCLHLGAANPSIHPLVLKGWQQQRWKKIRSCNRSQAHSPALDCRCSPEQRLVLSSWRKNVMRSRFATLLCALQTEH